MTKCLVEMEYLSQEMLKAKTLLIQSNDDFLKERQIWKDEKAMLLKKVKELEEQNKSCESKLYKCQTMLYMERDHYLKEKEALLKIIGQLSI